MRIFAYVLAMALTSLTTVEASPSAQSPPKPPWRPPSDSIGPDSPLGLPEHLPRLAARPSAAPASTAATTGEPAEPEWQTRRGAEAASWEDVTAISTDSNHGRVFVLSSATGLDSGFDIVTAAYDASTGATLWRDRFDLDRDADVAKGIVVDPGGGGVYVSGYSFAGNAFHSTIIAIDAATGVRRWVRTGEGIDATENGIYAIDADDYSVFVAGTVSMWPAAGSSFVNANLQYSYLVMALDATTGAVRWRSAVAQGQIDVARAVEARGGKVFVTGTSRTQLVSSLRTIALDATTGAQVWQAQAAGQWDPELSVEGERVFVGGDGGDGGLVLAYDGATGRELWRSTRAGQTHGLKASGGRVFAATTAEGGADPFVVALDASTGAELWSDRYIRSGAQLVADLATSRDGSSVVLLGSTESAPRDLLIIAYDAATGARRWLVIADGGSGRTDFGRAAAVAGSRVYAAANTWNGHALNDEHLAAFDAGSGTAEWRRSYDGPGNYGFDVASRSALTGDGSTLFVTGEESADGGRWTTYAHDTTTGATRWKATHAGPVGDVAAGLLGETPRAIAVSPDDSRVFLTGAALAEVPSSSGIASSRNWMTATFDARTGAKEWSADSPGLPAGSTPSALAVSPDGATLYVVGTRWSAFPPNGTSMDVALVAYDAATGVVLRQTRWDDGGDERPARMALSRDGTLAFFAGRAWRSDLGYHYLVAAFDTTTLSSVWTARLGLHSESFTSVTGLLVSPDGSHVYLGGSREVPGETDAVLLRSVADTIALDAASGSLAWQSTIGERGTWADNVGIAVSPDGSRVYSAGRHISLVATASGFLVAGNDTFATAFDAATGARAWLDFYDSGLDGNVTPAPEDLTTSLAVSPDDALWTAGMTWNSATGWDFRTLRYDGRTGARSPARTFDGPSHNFDAPYAIKAGPAGVFVSGTSWGAGTSFDYVTIAYPLSQSANAASFSSAATRTSDPRPGSGALSRPPSIATRRRR